MRRVVIPLLTAVPLALALSSCAATQKKISPRSTFRAGFVASSDGKTFRTLLELMNDAEKARPSCKGVNRNMVTKAQYVVERSDRGIKLDVTECESAAGGNCAHLKECLTARPVAWLTRSSGRTPELAGTIYTDWLGSCGGTIAVNFYYGPQTPMPLEKVGCAEPAHDRLDTAYDMFLAPRPTYNASSDGMLQTWQPDAVGPLVEGLLRKWNQVVFGGQLTP